jgi:hypothetical protein
MNSFRLRATVRRNLLRRYVQCRTPNTSNVELSKKIPKMSKNTENVEKYRKCRKIPKMSKKYRKCQIHLTPPTAPVPPLPFPTPLGLGDRQHKLRHCRAISDVNILISIIRIS